jgi:hypothetical protein
VQLVDEEDDFAFALLDVFDHRLETVFELAAVLRAGDHRARSSATTRLFFSPSGHVAFDDAPRQTFDDRRLADARLADQHRIVLRAPRQHLDDAADFFVAADHRIELAATRERRQIAPVFFERLIFVLGILIRDPLRAAHRLQRLEHGVPI